MSICMQIENPKIEGVAINRHFYISIATPILVAFNWFF